MQHKDLGPDLRTYHRFLQGDHDFRMWAEVLTLEEKPVYDAILLDGQVNIDTTADGPHRTATLTLADPEHALSFGDRLADDDTGTIWVNRLVRVRHQVVVPGVGTITSTPFVGLPTSVSRNGGELGLELGDKSLLADHATLPKTYKRGHNAANAIRNIMAMTGEQNMHIPNRSRKLSRPYTVGMSDDSITPWLVAKKIARRELGWRLEYRADGHLRAEHLHAHRAHVRVSALYELPQSQVAFDDFGNYVKVHSKRKTKKATVVWEGVAQLPKARDLSAQSLARNGQPRWLPLYVDDDNLKSKKAVTDRAIEELRKVSGLDYSQAYSLAPFFHLDNGDRLILPYGIGEVPLHVASIPLAVGGPMTVGNNAWVSRPVVVKRKRVKIRHRVKKHKRKKDDQNTGAVGVA